VVRQALFALVRARMPALGRKLASSAEPIQALQIRADHGAVGAIGLIRQAGERGFGQRRPRLGVTPLVTLVKRSARAGENSANSWLRTSWAVQLPPPRLTWVAAHHRQLPCAPLR